MTFTIYPLRIVELMKMGNILFQNQDSSQIPKMIINMIYLTEWRQFDS